MDLKKVMRYLLGIMFLMTGAMKIFLPEFGDAFMIQLTEAGIPWPNFNFWMVPIIEILLGFFLLFKFKYLLALILIIPIMLVALYVHIVVVDPAAFPAQPRFPVIPIVVLSMVYYLIIKEVGKFRGGAAKSNLKNS